jgi:hypothetical protein
MGLELERGLKLFFQKNKENYRLLSSYIFLVVPLYMTFKEKFITLQFAHPMTQKSQNSVKE